MPSNPPKPPFKKWTAVEISRLPTEEDRIKVQKSIEKKKRKLQKAAERIADIPDDQIDTSDIPEVTDWSGAKRGKFHAKV